MRKVLLIVTVFSVMISLFVFPSFATDGSVADAPGTDQTVIIEESASELVAHGPRSERMLSLLAGYDAGLVAGETRFTLSDSVRYVFSDVRPGWAAVATWISARIQPDLFVYLLVLFLLYSIIGGYRRVKND